MVAADPWARSRTSPGLTFDRKRRANNVPNAITPAATVVPAVAAGVSFFQLSLAFLMGGLFFSTVVAVLGAIYAFGNENTRRAWSIARVVVRKVWAMVVITAAEVQSIFVDTREDSTWRQNLKEARKVLNEGFVEAKRVVKESLGAVKQGRTLYAAAVGGPGLITAQYALDHMMPHSIGLNVERALAGAIATTRHPNVRRMALTRTSAGKAAPQLQAARVYDLGPDAMAFDVDLRWESELWADINVVPKGVAGLAQVPVHIEGLIFDGTVRIVLTPLVAEAPGYGATLVSLPELPAEIALNVRVAGGEVTRVRWLRDAIADAMLGAIRDQLLWPRRMIIPAERPNPRGTGVVNVLSREQLDDVLVNDPMLQREAALEAELEKLRDRVDENEDAPGDVAATRVDISLKDKTGQTLMDPEELKRAEEETEEEEKAAKGKGSEKRNKKQQGAHRGTKKAGGDSEGAGAATEAATQRFNNAVNMVMQNVREGVKETQLGEQVQRLGKRVKIDLSKVSFPWKPSDDSSGDGGGGVKKRIRSGAFEPSGGQRRRRRNTDDDVPLYTPDVGEHY